MTLPDWMHTVRLGNSIAEWTAALGWAVVATAGIVVVRNILAHRLAAVAARTTTLADDALVEAIRSIRKSYALLITVGIALLSLSMSLPLHMAVRTGVIFVAVLQSTRTGNALVDFWVSTYAARRDTLDRTSLRAIGFVARGVLWVTILLIAIEATGFQVKTLLTGLGVGGIAVALAVQNILGDLFAAGSIVVDKPFVVGEWIAVDQFEGEVVHIGLKSTRVQSINGEEVVFANTDLLKSRVRNLTRRHGRRYVITLTLAPDTPAAQVARVPALVAEAVAADGRATLQRSHVVGIGLNGAEVETSIMVPGVDYMRALDTRQAVLLGILQRLEREGIVHARPVLVTPTASPGAATA
jgi:small-conductance mechanosensitive channel